MTELKLKKIVQIAAYFAIVFLAIALVLKAISSGDLFTSIAGILTSLANIVAYALVAVWAFFYVKTKRNVIYIISYIVAVILVIIFMIVPLF